MLTKIDLLELLKGKGLEFQIHNHDPLFTVEDSENLRGKIVGGHSKNLFLKNKKNDFYLLSCDERAHVDLKRFAKSINAQNLSFAKSTYLQSYLGIKPGSVSPYALLNDIENKVNFYLDEKIVKNEMINFHPLINTTTITTRTKDFIGFILENKKKINIFSLEKYSIVDIYE